MIPSNFQQLFGTLATGVIIFAVIFYSIYVLRFLSGFLKPIPSMDRSFMSFSQLYLGKNLTAFTGFIAITLIYASGIIFEHHVQYLTDQGRDTEIIPREGSIRLQTIVKSITYNDGFYLPINKPYRQSNSSFAVSGRNDFLKIELNSLGKAIFSYHKLDLILPPPSIVTQIRDQIDEPVISLRMADEAKAAEELKMLEGWCSGIYYQAKNWTFSNPTYFQELDTQQYRVDFLWALVYLFDELVVNVVVSSFLLFGIGLIYRTSKDSSFRVYQIGKLLPSFILSMLISGMLLWLNGAITDKNILVEAYRNAEIVYNEKAYGYFFSHVDYHKLSIKTPE